MADVQSRVRRLVVDIREKHEDEDTIALVGHGGSLVAIAIDVLDLPISSRQKFRISNTGISSFRVTAGNAVMDGWNDTSHWPGPIL